MRCETAFNCKAIHFNPEFVESPEWHPDLIKQAKPKARCQPRMVCSTNGHASLHSRVISFPRLNPGSKFPSNHLLKTKVLTGMTPANRIMFYYLLKTDSLKPKKRIK